MANITGTLPFNRGNAYKLTVGTGVTTDNQFTINGQQYTTDKLVYGSTPIGNISILVGITHDASSNTYSNGFVTSAFVVPTPKYTTGVLFVVIPNYAQQTSMDVDVFLKIVVRKHNSSLSTSKGCRIYEFISQVSTNEANVLDRMNNGGYTYLSISQAQLQTIEGSYGTSYELPLFTLPHTYTCPRYIVAIPL